MNNMFLSSGTNKQQLIALAKCRYPELKHLVELFEEQKKVAINSLLRADEPTRIYRLQERVVVLENFLEAVDKANSILERLK